MTTTSVELIKQLRELTGAGMMDCRRALEEAGGDLEKAVTILKERGLASAAKRAGRATSNGVIEAYLHRTGEDYPPQVGAMVELNCETDFVAKGEDFRSLARELAIHIAGAAPHYVSREEVPAEIVEEKRSLFQRQAEQDGEGPEAIAGMVEEQLQDFFQETCLMDQPYVRDPSRPVRELVAEAVGKLQENITVRRFSRFSIREG